MVLHVDVFLKMMKDKNREVKPMMAQTHSFHSKKRMHEQYHYTNTGRKQVQTARSEDQSLHTCPCISDRQLRLQSHGPESSAKTMHKDTLEKSTRIKHMC